MKIPSLASDCSAPYCSCVDADLLGASKLAVHFTILPMWKETKRCSVHIPFLLSFLRLLAQLVFRLYSG